MNAHEVCPRGSWELELQHLDLGNPGLQNLHLGDLGPQYPQPRLEDPELEFLDLTA